MPDSRAVNLQAGVISHLFGVTLALHSAASALETNPVAARIIDASRELDQVIAELRAGANDVIPRGPAAAQRDHLRWMVEALCPVLDFEPAVTVVSTAPDDELGVLTGTLMLDVAGVISEGLANVADHAQAGSAKLVLGLGATRVSVEIVDDGVGMPPQRRGPGLDDLERRALRRHGTFEVRAGVPNGTHLTWTAPLMLPQLLPQRSPAPPCPDGTPATPASTRTRSSSRASSLMGAVASTSRSAGTG